MPYGSLSRASEARNEPHTNGPGDVPRWRQGQSNAQSTAGYAFLTVRDRFPVALQQVRSYVARGWTRPRAIFHVAQTMRLDLPELRKRFEATEGLGGRHPAGDGPTDTLRLGGRE